MGEFKAGSWIFVLTLYFFCFFLIVYSVINGMGNEDIQFSNPGFDTGGASPQSFNSDNVSFNGSQAGEVDYSASTGSYNSVKTTLSIITGVNSGNVDIGLPGAFQWIFSFIFFWLPFFMFVWSIYMALPVIH